VGKTSAAAGHVLKKIGFFKKKGLVFKPTQETLSERGGTKGFPIAVLKRGSEASGVAVRWVRDGGRWKKKGGITGGTIGSPQQPGNLRRGGLS